MTATGRPFDLTSDPTILLGPLHGLRMPERTSRRTWLARVGAVLAGGTALAGCRSPGEENEDDGGEGGEDGDEEDEGGGY